jgi:hypothetical protein
MALGTLGYWLRMVFVWWVMASLAIGQPIVAEIGIVPLVSVVAIRTLRHWPGVLIVVRGIVASLAVVQPIVAEVGVAPVVGAMALGTLA